MSEHTVCEQDTREKLEADVHQYANPSGYKNTLGASWEKKMLSFLDRQAEITEYEVKERVDFSLIAQTANALFPDYQERIDELTAERDEWKAKAEQAERAMNRAAGKWAKAESRSAKRAEAVERLRQLPPMDTSGMRYVRAMLGSVVGMTAQDVVAELIELLEDDELTAERDELQAAIDAMGNGQMYAMYRQACEERDALRERLEAIRAALHDKPGT